LPQRSLSSASAPIPPLPCHIAKTLKSHYTRRRRRGSLCSVISPTTAHTRYTDENAMYSRYRSWNRLSPWWQLDCGKRGPSASHSLA